MGEKLLKQLDSPNSPFLVYTSAGKHAQIHRWLKGRRNFDLWITGYDSNTSLIHWANYYTERKGAKFSNLYYDMQEWPELFRKYTAVYVSDDDLHISGSAISELFRIRERFDLHILQPAFKRTGKLSHMITRSFIGSYLHYTNFVEVTCPLIRFDKLEAFMKDYDPSLIGHGIDYWFMHHIVGNHPQKAAIVDAILVYNPHDSTKGEREIDRLQSKEKRLAEWERIKSTRNLSEINPQITWSILRRYDKLSFYTSTIRTVYYRVLYRIWRKLKSFP